MRALAEYAMRGRTQAVTVVMLTSALPLLFWLSAATVALATLRKGAAEGLGLLLWASLPAVIWLVMRNDPTPLVVIVGSGILGVVLRISVSWVHTLVAGVLLGIMLTWVMPLLLPEVVAETIRISKQVLAEMTAEISQKTGRQLEEWLYSLFAGVLGSVHLFAVVGCVVLARWWQSALYNPGGFREEFHRLILPRTLALPLMLFMLLGGGVHPLLLGWIPVLTVPFVVAAIALVHGMVALRKLAVQWLFAFYLMVFLLGPYFYILLIVMAILDSVLDFRGRIRAQIE